MPATPVPLAGPTLVLDLDGTLIDTLPDLCASLNRLLAAHRLEPFAPEAVRALIGDGARALVSRGLTARGRTATEADQQAFLADYNSHVADESRPYPGAAAALQAARTMGWRIAVCTNKPEAPARALLELLLPAEPFDAICGGDSVPARKPDPAHLRAAIDAAGGDPAAAVMVGDGRNDVLAANAAGIPVIFARWGYGDSPADDGATASATSFAEAMEQAAGLLKASPHT